MYIYVYNISAGKYMVSDIDYERWSTECRNRCSLLFSTFLHIFPNMPDIRPFSANDSLSINAFLFSLA